MVYAYPNITKVSDLAVWSNSVTSGMFFPLILLALSIILFFSFKQYSTERAFATSSFVTMIIGILMGVIGLVNSYVVILTMVIAGISVVVLRNTNNREY